MKQTFFSFHRSTIAGTLVLAFASSVPLKAARADAQLAVAPTSRTQRIINERTKNFYAWYVGQLKRRANPFENRVMVRRYVSRRLEKRLYAPAFKEFGADYFVNAQDFASNWDEAHPGTFFRRGSKATLWVALGETKAGRKGLGARHLKLTWVRENGVWKLDRVNDY